MPDPLGLPGPLAVPAFAPGGLPLSAAQDVPQPGLPAGAAPYTIGGNLVSGTPTSRSLTVTATTDPGDTLLVAVQSGSATQTCTACTDSQGNVYVLDGSTTSTAPQSYWFRSAGATGGAGGGPTAPLQIGDTITITTGSVSSSMTFTGTCVPGAGPLDAVVGPSTQNSTNTVSLSATPAEDGALIVIGAVTQLGPGAPIFWPPASPVYVTGLGGAFIGFAYNQLGAGTAGVAQASSYYTALVTGNTRSFQWVFQPPTVSQADVAAAADDLAVSIAGGYVVTAAQGGSTQAGILLRVIVLTNANTTQDGLAKAANAALSVATGSPGTSYNGSRIYGACLRAVQGALTPTAPTQQYDSTGDATHGLTYGTFRSTSASVPAFTNATYGDSDASGAGVALAEIRASGGTLTEDASTPAAAATTTATSAATASFIPPAGSILLALVSSDGAGSVTTMTVSDSQGLAWTEKVKQNAAGNGYAGVWWAAVPGGTASPALPEAAGAADQLAAQAAVPAADAAGAADQLSVSVAVPVSDQGGAGDVWVLTAAVPLADQGGSADAISPAAAVPLAEQAGGADALATPAKTLPLADAAGAAEALSSTAAVPLADAGAASYAQTPGPYAFTQAVTAPLADQAGAAEAAAAAAAVPLADQAGGTEASVAAASVPLPDAGAAADALSVGGASAPALAEAAGAADTLAVTVAVPLADAGSAADALATPARTIPSADTAAAAETSQVSASVPVADTAAGADVATASAAVPLPDAGGAADALTAAVTSPAADVAAGADALTVQQGTFISLLDSAGAADAPTVAAAVPVVDAAAASDSNAIGSPVALADTGAAADAAVAAASVSLADAAAGRDQVITPAAVPLADSAAAADAESVAAGASPPLNDAAAGADQLAAAAAAPLAEAAGAADTLSVIAGALAAQADAAGAADSLAVSVQAALPDAAGAADGLATAQAAHPVLGDAAAVTDALSAAVAAPSHDVAAASDSLAVQPAVQRAVSDSAGATDSIVVTVPITAPQPVWRCGAAAQRLSCAIAALRWAVAATAARWDTEAARPRWAARLLAARWRITMADFDPVAAVSAENVNVTWTSDLAGDEIDPTAAPMPVSFAFPVSSGNQDRPAEPVSWLPGTWLDPAGRQKGWIAQVMVGPTADGGLVQLAPGQSYDVWSQVDTGTETPRKFAGVLAVY